MGTNIICNPIGYPFGSSDKLKLSDYEGKFIGLLIDMKDNVLSYVVPSLKLPNKLEVHKVFGGFVESVRIIACVYKDCIISFSRYINNRNNIFEYLENKNWIREKFQKEYVPVSFENKKFKKITWSKTLKGKNIFLSNNKKQFKTKSLKDTSSSVLSDQIFEEGLHYIELFLDSSSVNLVYVGVAQKGSFDYEEEPRCNEKILAIGPKLITDNSSKFSGEEKLKKVKFSGKMVIGIIIDMKRRELSYWIEGHKYLGFIGVPLDVQLYLSIEGDVTISFIKYLDSLLLIERRLKKLSKIYKEYTPKKAFSYDMEFSTLKKGSAIWLSKNKKSLFTEISSPYNCVVSEKIMKTGVHFIEIHIDNKSREFFFGIANSEIKKFEYGKKKFFIFFNLIHFNSLFLFYFIFYLFFIFYFYFMFVLKHKGSLPKRQNSGIWAIGLRHISNNSEDFINNEDTKNFLSSLGECETIGMIVDMRKRVLSFVTEKTDQPVEFFKNISDSNVLFICASNHFIASLSNYLVHYQEGKKKYKL